MAHADLPRGVRISYRRQYRRCGKPGCARCLAGGPGHGPYWYATWWAEGRRHSRYLGTAAPAEAAAAGADAPPATRREQALEERPPPAALSVQALGGFAVWRGAILIAPDRWRSQRARALFQCLLSTPGHRLHREQAIEWLWPEADPGAGATNLRTTLHRLRAILDEPAAGASYVRAQGTQVVLEPCPGAAPPVAWLDAAAFAHGAAAALAGSDPAACRAALARYAGDYLPDEPYAAWAEPMRTTLRHQRLELLRHLARLSGAQGELEESERCLRRLLAVEPTDEEAAGALMGLLAASGRRPEALRVYQALATALEEELDVPPDAALAALRARLLAQEAAPRAAALPPPPMPGRPTNLPAALSGFVGRTWELAELADLLAGSRLVTLTGPGGCGKTRLALEVAARQVDLHPEGVWLVELAGLAAPELLPQAVAAALGIVEQPGVPLRQTLAAVLRPRRALLLLDNCEHLLAACAALAQDLLAACPPLRVLATSRATLGVGGERTYQVPSLGTPDPAHLPPPAQLSAYEAVQLFLERAQAHDTTLRLTADNAHPIATICARLDGLPLALELAAARTGLLSLAEIAARLDDRLGLLTSGPRTALPRQQTLRASIDWSYHLLVEAERVLLRRLSVFSGGWTLAAAAAVCAGAGVSPHAVLDLLGGLVQQSLVVVERREDAVRYRLLETVRLYAQEQLEESAEAEMVRRAHARHVVGVVEGAAPHLVGPEQGPWLEHLERELDNVRAALHWAQTRGQAELGLRLATALERFWHIRGHWSEARTWVDGLLSSAASADVPPPLRVQALRLAALVPGDPARRRALTEERLALCRDLGDPVGMALARLDLAHVDQDAAQILAQGEECLALARERGDDEYRIQVLRRLGTAARRVGRYERAVAWLEEARQLCRARGDSRGSAEMALGLGMVARAQGADGRAVRLLEESLAVARHLGDKGLIAPALHEWGRIACAQGDYARAATLAEEARRLFSDLGDHWGVAVALTTLGSISQEQGDPAHAAALYEDSARLFREVHDRHGEARALAAFKGAAPGQQTRSG